MNSEYLRLTDKFGDTLVLCKQKSRLVFEIEGNVEVVFLTSSGIAELTKWFDGDMVRNFECGDILINWYRNELFIEIDVGCVLLEEGNIREIREWLDNV